MAVGTEPESIRSHRLGSISLGMSVVVPADFLPGTKANLVMAQHQYQSDIAVSLSIYDTIGLAPATELLLLRSLVEEFTKLYGAQATHTSSATRRGTSNRDSKGCI